MKVLFKVFPQKSHFNATFPFARSLQDAGHQVIYCGVVQLKSHAEAQGFDYHVEAEDVIPYQEPNRDLPRLSLGLILKNRRIIKQGARVLKGRILARPDSFGPLLRAIKPDIILVDSPYTLFALSLICQAIPFAMLESMMRLDQDAGCPPLDTDYVPSDTKLNNTFCSLHWRRYALKKALFGMVGVRVDFNPGFVFNLARRLQLEPSTLEFSRYFHFRICNRPEFILSPEALDFPRPLRENQFYVGTSVELTRQEVSSDYRFASLYDRAVVARGRGTPLVYCSLGTANWRYVGAEKFLHRVIDASRGQRWNLILVVGNEFSLESFCGLPANVNVFQSVPQLQVLRQCDLMITHGGMNSITECVLLGVPMLVYPGTSEIDQAGNAARVVFHRAGLKGRMVSESAVNIRRKIVQILNDKTFGARVAGLREQLSSSPVDRERSSRLIETARRYATCEAEAKMAEASAS